MHAPLPAPAFYSSKISTPTLRPLIQRFIVDDVERRVLQDSACDGEFVAWLLANWRTLRDQALEDRIDDISVPSRGTGMVIAGNGLERRIAGLEVGSDDWPM